MIFSDVFLDDRNADAIGKLVSEKRPELTFHSGRSVPSGINLSKTCLITFDPSVDLAPLDGLGWIHCIGAGVDKLLAKLPFNVPLITRTIGNMGDQIAEYVLAHMLFDTQKIAVRKDLQANARWDRKAAAPSFLAGQHCLVLGTGSVGSGIARCLSAMGMRVTGVSRQGKANGAFAQTISLNMLKAHDLSRFGYVVLALPGTPEAHHVADQALLARLSGAMLFNVGRGEALDLGGLRHALDRGHVRHAVLDVFGDEPLPPAHWLWSHPDITVTPHVAGLTWPSDAAAAFLENLARLEAGQPPLHVIDPARGY